MKVAKLITTLAAITAVTFLEYRAMDLGFDGTLLAGALAIIGALAGYEVKGILTSLKSVKPPK